MVMVVVVVVVLVVVTACKGGICNSCRIGVKGVWTKIKDKQFISFLSEGASLSETRGADILGPHAIDYHWLIMFLP